jgi:hypothetical protein
MLKRHTSFVSLRFSIKTLPKKKCLIRLHCQSLKSKQLDFQEIKLFGWLQWNNFCIRSDRFW